MSTIVVADAMMGLDNVLAVAGAAHGRRFGQLGERTVLEICAARCGTARVVVRGCVRVRARLDVRRARRLHIAQRAKQQEQHGEQGE